MRTLSPALQAELQGTAPRIARLLKITLVNGTVHAFTDSDMPLTIDGQLYEPAPGLTSVKYTATADTQVSSQTVGAGWTIDAPQSDLQSGVFDNANIEAAWACWAIPSAGRLVTFQGQLGELTYDESGFSADVVSFMKRLERNIGWTYTSNCRHDLFSQPGVGRIGACMVDPASYTFTGTVTSILTNKWRFTISGATGKGAGYFSAGQITFTSGLNTGLSAVVKEHSVDSSTSVEMFSLFLPTAFVIPTGTTFSVQAGCDKTLATCKAKFDNVINHGGFPNLVPNVQYR